MARSSKIKLARARRSARAGVALCAVLVISTPCVATAAPSNPTNEARLDRTVRFLQNAQNLDGGFGGEPGTESSQLFSAWVALALGAAGINPQDQAKPAGASVYTYLTEHVAQAIRAELCGATICTTAFERELLVVDASCTSPDDYGGIDLVRELLARKLPDGSFPFVPGGHGEVNDTIFAILSLSPIEEPAAQAAVELAAKWVIEQQNTEGSSAGSWSWQNKGSEGEADMTGAAIEALNAAGMPDTEAQRKAIKYLHGIQQPDGGFPEFASEHESNSASTAWATQGIWAAGENPETWTKESGREPLDYLESMQQPDGDIRYREREELNGIWMAAYTGPAYAGQTIPYACPPRNPLPSTPPSSPGGGGGTQSGSGVIAGGGGIGAPLYSRPQPGSKGYTPGGARLLDQERKPAIRHRRNPGPPRRAPVPTATAASVHRPKKRNEEGRKGAGGGALSGTGAGGGTQAGGRDVKGVLIGAPTDALEPGAPGLHSAGAEANRTPWLTIAIAGAAALLALSGSLLERRRPEVIV